jgi:hypothetical protein
MSAIEKWFPIMECLGVTNSDKVVKMSEYSENFAKNEMLKVSSIDKIDINLLPLNLRILKDLDNFEITDDASQVNDVIYKISIDKNSELDSIDYINELEGSLIDIMVKDLKEKNILIYSLVNNMFIDSGKLVISSRIKIIN